MAQKFKVEGLKELNEALKQFPKATGNAVLRRALVKAAEPIDQAMRSRAPTLTGWLKSTVKTGTKLNPAQAKEHRAAIGTLPKMTIGGYRSQPSKGVYVFVGPAPSARSITQEFGSVDHAPQPFARPAWDGNKMAALERVKGELEAEIAKTAKRLAAKAARQLAKIKK